MHITCKFFAMLRDRTGVDQMILDLPEGATVSVASEQLENCRPELKGHLDRIAYAVNREYAAASKVLNEGDELALIPPVSGG